MTHLKCTLPSVSRTHGSEPRVFLYTMTEMDVEDQASDGYTDEDIEGRVPMGRFARPEDVAQAVAFLADPELSAFVNGHTLSVDGGWFGDGGWESLRRRKQSP
jgi:NAD(P)-dependent dehydrogenase (short-subunit alcohol dehydrogenase family)